MLTSDCVVSDVTMPVQWLERSFTLWEEAEERNCGTMIYMSLTQVCNKFLFFITAYYN